MERLHKHFEPGARPSGIGLIEFSEFKTAKGISSDRIAPWIGSDGSVLGVTFGSIGAAGSIKFNYNLAVTVARAFQVLGEAMDKIRAFYSAEVQAYLNVYPSLKNSFPAGGMIIAGQKHHQTFVNEAASMRFLMPGEPVIDHDEAIRMLELKPLKPFTLTEEDLKTIQGKQLTKKQERKIARAEKKKQHVPKNLFKGKKR